MSSEPCGAIMLIAWLVLEAANPGNPALCLSLAGMRSEWRETTVYTHSVGSHSFNGTRGAFGTEFWKGQRSGDHREFRVTTHSKPACGHTSGRLAIIFQPHLLQQITSTRASNLGEPSRILSIRIFCGVFCVLRYEAQLCCHYTYSVFPSKASSTATNRLDGQGLSISGITRFQHRVSRHIHEPARQLP